VTLLDAYGLVAFVLDDPAARIVEKLLREDGSRIVIANLAEAIDVSQRVHHVPSEEVRAAIEPLFLDGSLTTVVSDEPEAWLAADLRVRHYDRRARALSLADCLLLAHALIESEAVATADPPVVKVARDEGIGVVRLPDSAGKLP